MVVAGEDACLLCPPRIESIEGQLAIGSEWIGWEQRQGLLFPAAVVIHE